MAMTINAQKVSGIIFFLIFNVEFNFIEIDLILHIYITLLVFGIASHQSN